MEAKQYATKTTNGSLKKSKNNLETNENENIMIQNLWDAAKAVLRREAKSKGEKERYTPLNAEFQRIARRDKKAFPSEEREEMQRKRGKQ